MFFAAQIKILPYSRNFSRIITEYYLQMLVDKDRAIALIREKLYLVHSRKFSPTKISHYTVGPTNINFSTREI